MKEFDIYWNSVAQFIDTESEEGIALKKKYAQAGWDACHKAAIRKLDEATYDNVGDEVVCPYEFQQKILDL